MKQLSTFAILRVKAYRSIESITVDLLWISYVKYWIEYILSENITKLANYGNILNLQTGAGSTRLFLQFEIEDSKSIKLPMLMYDNSFGLYPKVLSASEKADQRDTPLHNFLSRLCFSFFPRNILHLKLTVCYGIITCSRIKNCAWYISSDRLSHSDLLQHDVHALPLTCRFIRYYKPQL